MTNLLQMKISQQVRSATITQIKVIKVYLSDRERTSEKVEFTVVDQNKNEFKISDALIDHKRLGRKIQGLWLTTFENELGVQEISSSSALAQVMNHYGVVTLEELVDKNIMLYPDADDYLVILACDIRQDGVSDS